MSASFEPIVGRYLHLELLGKEYRVYVEEAGAGIPLLCLHTAGADSRQFRCVMNDSSILSRFRVIAFDLPWHGKSSPPAEWQAGAEYRLTSKDYLEVVMGVADAMSLERTVVMGCSIGGRVVLHLAAQFAHRFSAVIGLQTSAFVKPYFNTQWLHRPDVHGGEICAAIVSGLMAPESPDAERWETLWHYMQSGPGVFKGDLYFYQVDGDIRPRLAEINTSRCPVYLLTGEYDYSCSPRDTLELAKQLEGVKVTIMEGIGHFPMSENPKRFLGYLRPVLEQIANERNGGAS